MPDTHDQVINPLPPDPVPARPFRRGALITLRYYGAAVVLFAILFLPPFHDGIFLVVILVPGIILLGSVWWVVDLVRVREPWFRGSLLVNTIALIPLWYLLLTSRPLGGAEIPLSEQEQAFESDLSRRCACEATILHDFDAVRGGRSHGTVQVNLDFSGSVEKLCQRDSTFLQAHAREVTRGLATALGEPGHYSTASIRYYSEAVPDDEPDDQVCRKYIDVNLNDYTIQRFENEQLKQRKNPFRTFDLPGER